MAIKSPETSYSKREKFVDDFGRACTGAIVEQVPLIKVEWENR